MRTCALVFLVTCAACGAKSTASQEYEEGYLPGTAAECAPLRAALLEDTPAILAASPPATAADPREPLEAALAARVRRFVERQCYRLPGWAGEDGVHLTGESSEVNTHGWVRVWYSPEVAAWLERGRPAGEVPAQAIIVKERFTPIGEGKTDGVFKLVGWQPMIRRPGDSRDGWFWAEVAQEEARHGAEVSCARPQLAWSDPATLRLDDCRPPSRFGQPCVRCHASSTDSTYAQLTHLPAMTGGGRAAAQIIYDYRRKWRDVDGDDPTNGYQEYRTAPPSTYVAPHPDRDLIAQALPSADPDFVRQHGVAPDEAAPYQDLPRFFDHSIARPEGHAQDTFLTSDQCWSCHSGVAHISEGPSGSMLAQLGGETAPQTDVSPYGFWSVSLMGLSGRDPVFRAQHEWETDHRPACAAQITDTCYRCHGAAGQQQMKLDTPDREFSHDLIAALPGTPDGKYGALARDGITCTVCHQMSAKDLGTPASYTGQWTPSAPDDLLGPYTDDVRDVPMKRALGKKPAGDEGRAEVIKSAAMCGSCHAVRLPKWDVGKCVDLGFFYEQATFLEWRNSDYRKNDRFITDEGHDGANPRPCQSCHMSNNAAGVPFDKKIASIEDSDFPIESLTGVPHLHEDVVLQPRTPFSLHTFHGINLFALSMFAQAPRIFGVADFDYMSNQYSEPTRLQMAAAIDDTRAMAGRAASLAISTPRVEGTDLVFEVTVTANPGHKLPTGVGFRRIFLEVGLEDESGQVVWASGRSNAVGEILGPDGEVLPSEYDYTDGEPHHQTITREDQVQIYEERVADSNGRLTTSFLGISRVVKDNRVLPKGWKAHFAPTMEDGEVPEGLEPHAVEGDPDYPADGSPAKGSDTVVFRIPLADAARHGTVRARLQYQALPPYYLRDRFSAIPLPDAQRLYQIASHLDTKSAKSAIPGWKLTLAEAVTRSGAF